MVAQTVVDSVADAAGGLVETYSDGDHADVAAIARHVLARYYVRAVTGFRGRRAAVLLPRADYSPA